jgi:hypothetical protein
MSRSVQFDLFPRRGYAIVLASGDLALDPSVHRGEPMFFRTRAQARRALDRIPQWQFAGPAEVRPIEIHGDPYEHGTFMVQPRGRRTGHRRSR